MVSFSFLSAISLLPAVLATNYVQNWSEGGSNVRFNSGSAGQFSVTWTAGGGFVVGKGWQPGGSR